MEGTTVLVLARYTLSLPAGAKPDHGHFRNITDVPDIKHGSSSPSARARTTWCDRRGGGRRSLDRGVG
jgi:hypothetical protein